MGVQSNWPPGIPFSDMIKDGKYDMTDIIQPMNDETNKKYGLNEKQE